MEITAALNTWRASEDATQPAVRIGAGTGFQIECAGGRTYYNDAPAIVRAVLLSHRGEARHSFRNEEVWSNPSSTMANRLTCGIFRGEVALLPAETTSEVR